MYIVESTDPYSEHPHLTDEHHEFGNPDEAVAKFAELAGCDEDVALEDWSEGGLLMHVDPETGRDIRVWGAFVPEAGDMLGADGLGADAAPVGSAVVA